jgi:hypothetical protein
MYCRAGLGAPEKRKSPSPLWIRPHFLSRRASGMDVTSNELSRLSVVVVVVVIMIIVIIMQSFSRNWVENGGK